MTDFLSCDKHLRALGRLQEHDVFIMFMRLAELAAATDAQLMMSRRIGKLARHGDSAGGSARA